MLACNGVPPFSTLPLLMHRAPCAASSIAPAPAPASSFHLNDKSSRALRARASTGFGMHHSHHHQQQQQHHEEEEDDDHPPNFQFMEQDLAAHTTHLGRSPSRILNSLSRWIVVGLVLAVIAWRHDDQVLWAVTGGILNAGNSKLLKKLFNQQRPLTALGLKADPGMPSSHAQSLGYLSLYAAFGLILWQGMQILAVIGAAVVLFCGAYLAWLRISEGLHTPAQVMVGGAFGCSMAGAWIGMWRSFVQEAVASSAGLRYSLYCTFAFMAICFSAFGIRKWRWGEA